MLSDSACKQLLFFTFYLYRFKENEFLKYSAFLKWNSIIFNEDIIFIMQNQQKDDFPDKEKLYKLFLFSEININLKWSICC